MITCFIFKHHEKKIHQEIRQAFLNFAFNEVFGVSTESLKLSVNDYGKPQVENRDDINFNISHCDGVIICAMSDKEIGVDVEKIRDFDRYAAKRVCNENELAIINNSNNPNKTFFSYWTLKESLGKALGVGLHYPLKENNFNFYEGKIFSSYQGLILKQFEVNDNYLISICTNEEEEKIELKEVEISGREFY